LDPPLATHPRGLGVEFTQCARVLGVEDACFAKTVGLEVEDGQYTACVGEFEGWGLGGGRDRVDEALDLEVVGGVGAGFEGVRGAD